MSLKKTPLCCSDVPFLRTGHISVKSRGEERGVAGGGGGGREGGGGTRKPSITDEAPRIFFTP